MFSGLLGGSWVVIDGILRRVTILIHHIRGLITPLITTHEPPSRSSQARLALDPTCRPLRTRSGSCPARHSARSSRAACGSAAPSMDWNSLV